MSKVYKKSRRLNESSKDLYSPTGLCEIFYYIKI